jgi:hypothetical protein
LITDAESADYEGYQYVPSQVQRDLNGGLDIPRSRPHPDDPSGEMWEEDKLSELYPRLAEKYDYHATQPSERMKNFSIFGSRVCFFLLAPWLLLGVVVFSSIGYGQIGEKKLGVLPFP